MPVPVSFLIGSPRRLVVAIVLFVVLDLTVLIINLWIAAQVAEDAVAINLAGRQRMLSQQTTKTLLLASHAPNAAGRAEAVAELKMAFGLFVRTLNAFDKGGEAQGGDGRSVLLRAVGVRDGREALAGAIKRIQPLAAQLEALLMNGRLDQERLRQAADYMVRHNREILALMNRLTSALEQDSIRRTRDLRTVQTGAFVLALANFLIIVLGLVRQYKHVERDRFHWQELARSDPLTGLANRAAFREAVCAEIENAHQEGKCFSVLMLDLDGFKPINDRYGHAVGDQLLVKLAARLKGTARESDLVCRLGGDEFAILCPLLRSEEHIGPFSGRVIAAIREINCDGGSRCHVDASIGIAVFPLHGKDADELLAAADRAMYQAKRAGGGDWKMAQLDR